MVTSGVALSAYLLDRHFALLAGTARPGVCSTVLHLDCDRALTSPLAERFGLPLAAWGVVHFGTLAATLLLAWAVAGAARSLAVRMAIVLSAAGACASTALLVSMTAGFAPFCPLCVAVHAAGLALPLTLLAAAGLSPRRLVGGLRADLGVITSGGGSAVPRLTVLAAALAALTLFQATHLVTRARTPPPFDVRHAIASFALSQRIEFAASERAPARGPADAPIRLDVFTDFECPACRAFAREQLHRLVERGSARVVLHHFPASRSCNPSVKDDRHPHACAAACAAEAARLQGAFWPFHDALLGIAGPPDEAALASAALAAGLDLARFEADRRSDEVRAAISDDVALGRRLGVDETPSVFVNGRRAPDLRPQAFSMFLMSERAGRPVALKAASAPPAK